MRRILLVIVVLALSFLARTFSGGRSAPSVGTANSTTATSPRAGNGTIAQAVPATTSGITRPTVGFRTRRNLEEHFAKHGAEFGGETMQQYLQMAQALRDAPVGGDIEEIVRPGDGVVSRFDRKSGAFMAFEGDGTIHTFFHPNDGESYFRRQAKRSPNR